MNKEFNLTLSDLEIGNKYVMSTRPDSFCYVDDDGYIQDYSLYNTYKGVGVSINDRFKRYDPREYLNIKVGDIVRFYGNEVKIAWIDHAYVTIEFINLTSKAEIPINRPKSKFKPQHYEWINELTCFEPILEG